MTVVQAFLLYGTCAFSVYSTRCKKDTHAAWTHPTKLAEEKKMAFSASDVRDE
jgi:hypothetical protein